MLQGCELALFTALGIAVVWVVAIGVGLSVPGTLAAALVAAGIISAFTVPQLLRGLAECNRRRRR